MQNATRGDEPAIEELLVRFLPELHAYVRMQMGGKVAARESSSDLVQSVCREVLQDLGDLEWRGEAAFKRLLFVQAERKVRSRGRFHGQQRRDAGRELPLDLGTIAAGAASLLTPSRVAIGREEQEALLAAVEQLPEDQRRVLLMCRALGMAPSDAAAELGKTANAVRVTLHRALAKLSLLLEQLDP